MIFLTTPIKEVVILNTFNLMDSIILNGLNEYGICVILQKECAFGGEESDYNNR